MANGQFWSLFMVDQPDPAQMQSGVEWDVEIRELLLDLEEKVGACLAIVQLEICGPFVLLEVEGEANLVL